MKTIPLLLIHGYPFDHTLWFSTIASLGSKAKVIAPDLPGFGKADLLRDTEPSMDAYAQFLLDHLSENKHDKVAVVGMSMGGYVALAFAERYPDRVAGLGLISSQAVSDSEDARKARQEMISKITAQDPSVAAEAIIPKMFGQKHASNPDLLKYPREGAERAGRNGLIWALQAMAARPDRTSVLTSLHCPVLVVHGSEDKIVPLSQAHLTADHSRKPIFVEIQGAGHATPLEAPDQVANALVRLLQTCQDAASA